MKPLLILDNHFRGRDELFRSETYQALTTLCDVRGGEDAPMPREQIEALLPQAVVYVAARPQLTSQDLGAGSKSACHDRSLGRVS